MKFQIEPKAIPAVLFCIGALVLLAASATTTTVAERAAEEARDGLIPVDKADAAADFTLPVATALPAGSPKTVDLLSAAKKEPVVFSFWASYCQYCPLEMTHLEHYAGQYKGKVQFYTVNSNDAPEIIREYQTRHGFSLPVLSDSTAEVAQRYGVDSLPTIFIVDKEGRIRYASSGFDPQMDQVFPKLLDDIVREG